MPRNGGAAQRDDRRRRVRLDERVGSAKSAEQPLALRAEKDGDKDAARSAKTYHEAARAESQKRVTELIPTRASTFFILALVGITALAGIQALYGQYEDWARVLGRDCVAALHPVGPASLASWFSCLILAGCSLTALMISKRIADSAVPMSLLADHPNVQFHYFRGGIGTCEVEMH